MGLSQKQSANVSGSVPVAGRSYGRWLIGGICFLIAGYFTVTSVAYWYVRYQRDVSEVEYLDLALPSRWPEYQIKRGNHHIQIALEQLKNGNPNKAFYHLRVGLARAPANRDGRLALAQLYDRNKRPDLAHTTLLDGLSYHQSDPGYVATVLRFLLGKSEDQRVVSLCDQLISEQENNRGITEIAGMIAAKACFYRGNYDRAEIYLASQNLTESVEGEMLTAQIEWERGYQELALLVLRDLWQKTPAAEEVYAKLTEYLRLVGHHEEAHQLAILHQIAHPERPRSYIDYLHALQQVGDTKALVEAEQRMLSAFKDDPDGLLALGDFAATNGQVALAHDIIISFRQHQWKGVTAVRLMEIEALLVAKHYAKALKIIQGLLKTPELEAHFLNVGYGLQAIAQYGVGDAVTAYVSLTALIAQPNLRSESLLAIANRLIAMGQLAPAREVLSRAVILDPQNQAALTRLVEFDLEAKNIPALTSNIPALIKMRKPSQGLLTRVQDLLRSDTYLFLPDRTRLLDLITDALPHRNSKGRI